MLPVGTRLHHHREVTTFLNLQLDDRWINCGGTEAESARFFRFNLHPILYFIATSWTISCPITPGNIGKCKGENTESWRECLASGNRKFVFKKQNITLKCGEQKNGGNIKLYWCTRTNPNFCYQWCRSWMHGMCTDEFLLINFWNFWFIYLSSKRKISNNFVKFYNN